MNMFKQDTANQAQIEVLPLNLIFFTSTKGHFGHKDIYKHTLNNLKSKIDPKLFKNKVAHIKISVGEQDVALQMQQFLRSWGFNHILTTVSDWSHNANHGEEYTKDVQKTFDYISVNGLSEYSLWMEDDYIFHIDPLLCPETYLEEYLGHGINALMYNLNLLSVRFNLDKPEEDKIKKYDELLYLQKKDYTKYGPTFTFQPNIVRSKDIWWAYCVFQRNNWELLKQQHIELRSGYSLFPLTNNPTPFSEFHYDVARSVHIGTPDYKDILKKYK